MIRLIFASVLVLHGLMHIIGFAKEWNIGSQGHLTGKEVIAFSDDTSKIAGTLWLATGVLFLTAAVFYLLHREWYWIPAAGGLVISQVLIIIYWQDARYGTLVNIIIMMVLIVAAAAMHFNAVGKRESKTMEARATPMGPIITDETIAGLPPNVQRWMCGSGVVGKANPNIIHIRQKGKLRTKPDGKWMPFRAVQFFSIDPPSFIWDAKIDAAPFVQIAGRDKFEDGKGHMLIKPLYIFTAANSAGKEIDQGTLLRYLAEMAWFPQAAASDYLQWEAIDDRRARVTMNYGGTTASGTYFFNDNGDVTGFEALRYGEFDGNYRREVWSISVTGYKTINGRRMGYASDATWKLKEGAFKWMMLEITEIN